MGSTLDFVRDPDHVRLALSPIRRTLLERLREPASATPLAAELGLSRQRVNYHLRVLERAGLFGTDRDAAAPRLRRARAHRERRSVRRRSGRARRGGGARARGEPGPLRGRASDRRGNGRGARRRAHAGGGRARRHTRLLTFTLETELRFAAPGDVERFADRLAELLQIAASELHTPEAGRAYRLVVGGHPAPRHTHEEGPQ